MRTFQPLVMAMCLLMTPLGSMSLPISSELQVRQLDGILGGESATSPTGSSTSTVGLLGSSSSSESASNSTSSSTSTSCELLGGCTSAAASSCETKDNDVNNTSSSICGSSTSTNSGSVVNVGGVGNGTSAKLLRAIRRALTEPWFM